MAASPAQRSAHLDSSSLSKAEISLPVVKQSVSWPLMIALIAIAALLTGGQFFQSRTIQSENEELRVEVGRIRKDNQASMKKLQSALTRVNTQLETLLSKEKTGQKPATVTASPTPKQSPMPVSQKAAASSSTSTQHKDSASTSSASTTKKPAKAEKSSQAH